MVLRVTASEFLGRTETGRSRPMQCVCENAAGDTVFAYVKYEGFHDDFQKDHLVGEVVANLFALDIGLPAAEPCLVTVEPDFVDLLPDDPQCDGLRWALRDAPLTAFGSVQLDPVRRWVQTDLVHKAQRQDATRLYLFDTLVENSDRGLGNPNLLMSGLDFKVIDFGHSFQRCHDGNDFHATKRPWEPGGITNHYPGNLQHIMRQHISPPDEAVFLDFTTTLAGLEDARILDYLACVPPEWGQDTACKIVDYLLEARDHAKVFTDSAKGVLR